MVIIPPARTLALDMSTKMTGWAADTEGSPRPRHGRIKLPGMAHLGDLYCRLEGAIDDLIETFRPGRLIFCTAMFRENQPSVRALNGLQAIAERTAFFHGIEAREVNEMTVRNCVLGRSTFGTKDPLTGRLNGDGRQQAKDAVMAWCHARGLKPGDDNDADALVLLKYDRMLRGGELTDDGKHVRGQPTRRTKGRVQPRESAGAFG